MEENKEVQAEYEAKSDDLVDNPEETKEEDYDQISVDIQNDQSETENRDKEEGVEKDIEADP